MAQKVKRQKDGTYRLTVSLGYDSDGKQRNVARTVNATSQRAAQRAWEGVILSMLIWPLVLSKSKQDR